MSEKSKQIIKTSYDALIPLAYQIFRQEPSLRLLAAFLQTSNYLSAQKVLCKNQEMPGMQRGGLFKDDKKLLSIFEEKWPAVKEGMDIHLIKPRAWCGAYRLINDYNQADICALVSPERYEMNEGDDASGYKLDEKAVLKYFKEDFPRAFPGVKYRSYSSAEVLPELYYYHRIAFIDGKTVHVLWNGSLAIQVMQPTFQKSFKIFEQRLRAEVKIHRMRYLVQMGVTTVNIATALAWLPKDVSQTRSMPGAKNTGSGHLLLEKAAQRAAQKPNKED